MIALNIIKQVKNGLGRGWVFTPLKGKKALRSNWNSEPSLPLEELCSKRESQNFGLRTGKLSGVLVIDVDPRHGGCAPGGLEKTVEVITGGGGTHLYFEYPSGHVIGCPKDKLGKGIYIKGEGGYVVFPGSIHPDTHKQYRWREGHSPEDLKVAPLPVWMVDLFAYEH